jgi:hypothetical protein
LFDLFALQHENGIPVIRRLSWLLLNSVNLVVCVTHFGLLCFWLTPGGMNGLDDQFSETGRQFRRLLDAEAGKVHLMVELHDPTVAVLLAVAEVETDRIEAELRPLGEWEIAVRLERAP